jgi:hypothetical protein
MGHTLLSVPVGEETSGIDRTEAASERAAVAMEGIADFVQDQADQVPARNGCKRIANA